MGERSRELACASDFRVGVANFVEHLETLFGGEDAVRAPQEERA